MADPAAHEARKDAERRGEIVGNEIDRTDDYLISATAGEEDGGVGAWMLGEFAPGVRLWGYREPL